MWSYSDFCKSAHPSHLVGGRVPLHQFPLVRWVHLPSYAALHMHSDRHINRWSVSPYHGSPPPKCPLLSGPSPFPARHCTHSVSFSEPPQVTIPPRSVSPVSESTGLCTYCHQSGHSIWHCDASLSESSALHYTPGTTPGSSHSLSCPSDLTTTPVLSHAPPQVFSGSGSTIPPVHHLMVPQVHHYRR